MKNFLKGMLFILPIILALFVVTPVKADSVHCFCSMNAGDVNAYYPVCQVLPTANDCSSYGNILEVQVSAGYTCIVAQDSKECKANTTNWTKQKEKIKADLVAAKIIDKKIAASEQSQFLPACILTDKLDLSSDCGDVTIFVKLMLDIVNYLLSFVGGLALLFFIYGGFVWIFSSGAPDKVTQGKEIVMSALIGLAVAFCGYVLISFLGDAIGISSVYKLK